MSENRDSIQMLVPELNADSQPARLINWLLSPPVEVIAGERVAEVLIDSIVFHLDCPHDGTLVKFLKPAGTLVTVGMPIAEIEIAQDEAEEPTAES